MLIIKTSCAQSTNRCHNTARPLRRSCVQRSLCHQGYCARCGAPGVMLGDGKTSWGALCGKCATVHCRLIPPQKTQSRNIHKALKTKFKQQLADTTLGQHRSGQRTALRQNRSGPERQSDRQIIRHYEICQQPAPDNNSQHQVRKGA